MTPSPKLPALARAAAIVAIILGALTALNALTQSIFVMPMGLVYISGGIGIVHRRSWSACGLALVSATELALVPVQVSRNAQSPLMGVYAVLMVIMGLLLTALYFFAGRQLSRLPVKHGSPWPWFCLSAFLLLFAILFQPFSVPTGSMQDTLLQGDAILVRRFPPHTFKRGEIAVFVYPVERKQIYVKRIIGMPGDRIRIGNKDLYLNGAKLREPYVSHKTESLDSYRDNFPGEPDVPMGQAALAMLKDNVSNGELTVPAGKYFVLGDNRDSSWDSRYWGFVPQSDLIGTPLLIYDSREPAGNQEKTETLPVGWNNIRWNRIPKVL